MKEILKTIKNYVLNVMLPMIQQTIELNSGWSTYQKALRTVNESQLRNAKLVQWNLHQGVKPLFIAQTNALHRTELSESERGMLKESLSALNDKKQ